MNLYEEEQETETERFQEDLDHETEITKAIHGQLREDQGQQMI